MEQTNEVQNPMEEALPNTEKVEETKNQEVEETTTQEVEETTAQDVEETKSQEVEETKAQEAEEAVAEAENAVAQNEAETQPAAEAEPETDYSALNREELVAAMRELLQQEIQNIKNRVASVRNRFNELNHEVQKEAFEKFLADGGNKEDYQPENDALAQEMHSLYEQYRTKRQKYQEELDEQKKRNLEAKQALIEEMRQLIDSSDEQVRSALDKFNNIQERWKAIGDVPREQMNDLWQNYHFQIEQFFNKLKINRELRALDQKRNLEEKIKLCESAEELIVEPSVTKAFKGLQDLRARWKEVGPVPAEQNEEIWQRFCNAANQIDERRKEYYDQRKEELDNNLLAKQALIDKAAELTEKRPESHKEWNDTTAALDELLKMWKTIGPVPREVNEEIWSKFKGMIDKHYSEKKEYFSTIRDEQEANYQKKIDLCLKAEAIAKREDWKHATEELLQLQQEWKSIGTTSRKVSDKVWQRFRKACDEFFAKKGEFFAERRSSESENLAKKEAILAELKAHQFGDNREENLAAIKEYQRRWAEVGFVPIAHKERLHKEFRAEIDGIFEKLKISAREAEETAYRERIRNAGAGARNFVHSERQELQEKIEKMRADLNLWENNLGFLANSKQADLLKQEFEKKMSNARQQIALMQAKLRILDKAEKEESEE
ncbi:MAG: DUF349 domain-containing protein [Bacteroidales bacterium]|nr:DUF349 domain-containing protein [Bacteroidales bacterium]